MENEVCKFSEFNDPYVVMTIKKFDVDDGDFDILISHFKTILEYENFILIIDGTQLQNSNFPKLKHVSSFNKFRKEYEHLFKSNLRCSGIILPDNATILKKIIDMFLCISPPVKPNKSFYQSEKHKMHGWFEEQ